MSTRWTPLQGIKTSAESQAGTFHTIWQENTCSCQCTAENTPWGDACSSQQVQRWCIIIYSPLPDKPKASCLILAKGVAGIHPNSTICFFHDFNTALHFSKRFPHIKKINLMLLYSRNVVTINCVMLVEVPENKNHCSVEFLTLIIIAYAVVRAHKGKRRLIITCPKSKIGGSGTPSVLLSCKNTVTQSSLKMLRSLSLWGTGQGRCSEHSAHKKGISQLLPLSSTWNSFTNISNAPSQTGPVTNLNMYTTEKHQLRKEPLPKTTALHFVIKFTFCHLLLSGT